MHHVVRGRRARKSFNFARQLVPKAITQTYAGQLLKLVRHMASTTMGALAPHLADWVRESDALHDRQDRAGDDAINTFAGIRLGLQGGIFSTQALRPIIIRTAETTAEFQREQLQRQLRVAVGVDVPIFDKGLGDRVDAFTSENVSLIQSIPQQSLQQVQQLVLRGLANGDRATSLQEQIQERFEVAESRAAIIARDQTMKFFSSLNESRQAAVGITHFYWNTANDERTCPVCGPLDGKRFAWNAPPADGPPGEIHPQCRCSADPDVEALLDSL